MFGLVAQSTAVAQRLGSLVKLHLELARLEAKKKAGRLARGVGLGGLALLLVLYAIAFGLAAAAVGANELLPLWASLLVVAGALLLAVAITVFLAVRYLRELSHPLPEQALAEIERTIKRLERHA